MKLDAQITWDSIIEKLPHATSIDEGYGGASRHIVTMADGQEIFVKIARDDVTAQRVQKEITSYAFLQRNEFQDAAAFITHAPDKTGFALEALTDKNGWEWSTDWTQTRLAKTLEAMDALALIQPTESDINNFGKVELFAINDAWISSNNATSKNELLADRAARLGYSELLDALDLAELFSIANDFTFVNDKLAHNDVRRDNCAWNPTTQQVKLIDWDWVQLGDTRIDINSLLVNAQGAGLDVTVAFPDRLNKSALSWLAYYWFMSVARPIWPGATDQLRDFQLKAAVTAYNLADQLD